MPRPNYISLEIGGMKADIDPDGQVPTVSYSIEDDQDFEQKKSAESFGIEMPATLVNDKIHNSMYDPSVTDGTINQVYDNFRPARYIANGIEILIGQYILQSVVMKGGRPVKYKGKIYGLNGDWVIALKEKTLLDFVNPRTHQFDIQTVAGSWNFDGRNEANDFVYAPVRYQNAFGVVPDATEAVPDPKADDLNVVLNNMKPSISVYWLLYRGFKSVGYRIVSSFLDSDYYRRGVMPWTWGGFDYFDDSRWEPLKFNAVQQTPVRVEGSFTGYKDLGVSVVGDGAYDNSGLFTALDDTGSIPYSYVWKYPAEPGPLNLGKITVNLSLFLGYNYKAQQHSDVGLKVEWYKNGIQTYVDTVYGVEAGGLFQGKNGGNTHESFFEVDIDPGDYIAARVWIRNFQTDFGFARQEITVEYFTLNFVKLTNGSQLNLKNFSKFNDYKWMDLLRGEIDLFDLEINTDPIRKEVYIEPAHAVSINGLSFTGYWNRKQIDWSQKVDISKESELELFSDYERELEFYFQDDDADGGLKVVQDRNQVVIGKSKFVLPPRYKTDKKPFENRFYAPVMHFFNDKFRWITGVSPQMIVMVPENISNTSGSASENTFKPKRAWYKGNVSGVGGWKFNDVSYTTLPYMFAVNYQKGGETDPVLSYSDQFIGGKIATGLLKKFFIQRMAILRNGRRFNPANIQLNNYDIANFLHRESIIIDGLEYILINIQDYDPITPESTACVMWMFSPATVGDRDNVYPSIKNVQNGVGTSSFDLKYWPHLLLTSDIPA